MGARGHFSTHAQWQQGPVQEIQVRRRVWHPDGGRTEWEEASSVHLGELGQTLVYFRGGESDEAATVIAEAARPDRAAEEAGPDRGAGSRRPASADAGAPDEVASRRASFPHLVAQAQLRRRFPHLVAQAQVRRRSRSRNRA